MLTLGALLVVVVGTVPGGIAQAEPAPEVEQGTSLSSLSALLPGDFPEEVLPQDLISTNLVSSDDSTQQLALQDEDPEQLAFLSDAQAAQRYIFSVQDVGNGQVQISSHPFFNGLHLLIKQAGSNAAPQKVEIYSHDSAPEDSTPTIRLEPGIWFIYINPDYNVYPDDPVAQLYALSKTIAYRVEMQRSGWSSVIRSIDPVNRDSKDGLFSIVSLDGGRVRLLLNDYSKQKIDVGIQGEGTWWEHKDLSPAEPSKEYILPASSQIIEVVKVDNYPLNGRSFDATHAYKVVRYKEDRYAIPSITTIQHVKY